MSSAKQIAANQSNSRKSTGPKTEDGKEQAAKNAIKHGLLSSETILPWEDDKAFEQLRAGLLAAIKPDGEPPMATSNCSTCGRANCSTPMDRDVVPEATGFFHLWQA